MHTFVLILLAALALMTISLQRTYNKVPLIELKRRALAGDELAVLLYRAAAYGHTLRAILWFFVGISNAAFFLLVALYTPAWFALTISAALIWIGFIWLPARDMTRFGAWVAARLAPIFAWLLHYLHSPLDWLSTRLRRHPTSVHTGLYERDDLLDLLERQGAQADNRVEKVSLDIALHALTAGDLLIRDVMVMRRKVKAVSTEDMIGPILMSELHDSGHSRFPVYEGKKDNIVGLLFLKDLVKAKAGGTVAKIMKHVVYYVHEEQPLTDALQAVLKTHHHTLLVINSQEEYVGIITIEDILGNIVGEPIIDGFDAYEDRQAVASRTHFEHEPTEDNAQTEDIELKVVHDEKDIDDIIEV